METHHTWSGLAILYRKDEQKFASFVASIVFAQFDLFIP